MTTDSTTPTPGNSIRALRKSMGLTLRELSSKTGLAASTLSKLETGQVSLSYDKLMLLSKGLGVDIARLLDSAAHAAVGAFSGGGRRVVHRAGEGHLVETRSYRQVYLATELLNKRFTPIIVELRARTMDEFMAEFGALISHPGEEFVLVLEGEVEFHTELYASLRLNVGDSVYFDSEMGHAYLKGSDATCRVLAACSPRGKDDLVIERFMNASEKHGGAQSVLAPPQLLQPPQPPQAPQLPQPPTRSARIRPGRGR